MGRSLCVVTFCFLAGCATLSVQQVDMTVRPERVPESITVLGTAPEQPYEIIARIDSRTRTVFEDYDDLRKEIIDQAAKLGGEAVILGTEETTTEYVFVHYAMIPSEKKTLSADVIVFR